MRGTTLTTTTEHAKKRATVGYIDEDERGELGRLLRDHRVRLGWSQADLAERAGVSPGFVGNYEVGRRHGRHGVDELLRIVQAMELNGAERREIIAATDYYGPVAARGTTPNDGRKRMMDTINRDPNLTTEQKDQLRAIYDGMVRLPRRRPADGR